MSDFADRAGLLVAPQLCAFLEQRALPGSGISADRFWNGLAALFARFTPENHRLLAKRDGLQAQIDTRLARHSGAAASIEAQAQFLSDIGYLEPEPAPFRIDVSHVDAELSTLAGPQLVVPVLNARFLLNAVNARWGSLYDALYGTDAIEDAPAASGAYDHARGARVVAWAKNFLDCAAPLASGSHAGVAAYSIVDGALGPALRDASQLAGYRGAPDHPDAILLRNHGLHIELVFDRRHEIGRSDSAGIADIRLEAALSTIVDFEDSVAAVDADDKVAAYANWLGVMRGDLQAEFQKNGATLTRTLAADRDFRDPAGAPLTLPGRSLLLARNVGLHMTTSAVRLADESDAFEGILDAAITSLIALHDIKGARRNGRNGSIYIVKPKLHGPEEAAFANALFDAVEDMLDLPRHTIKIGIMDEERRTSANLAACIHAVRGRIVFINTGFLDRTGDEIHTAMQAGPVLRKADMKSAPWLKAYEDRNVRIGLACGLGGRAQIGKGMWAAPNRMRDMLQQKSAHPMSGATTAWVPSPTAATLHATHYHDIDVAARQRALAHETPPPRTDLLRLPLANPVAWSEADVRDEIDNNVQSILGYVVRWVDQGVGCSTVPDIHEIGLMEDRATLRISSQALANWLMHGVATPDAVEDALIRMGKKVDAQNARDRAYQPMIVAGKPQGLAFAAAHTLIFEGAAQPNGYTEAILTRFRLAAKHHADAPHGAAGASDARH